MYLPVPVAQVEAVDEEVMLPVPVGFVVVELELEVTMAVVVLLTGVVGMAIVCTQPQTSVYVIVWHVLQEPGE